jgi:tRNA pseudouridine55 synthase
MITEGILNINKPQKMTSHDVVSVVRRTLGIRKVGHTGTLDPMATGVLPVCIGRSTRIIEYLDLDMKTYRCTMVLGIMTDTQDIWGEVQERCAVNVSEEEIRRAFQAFDGVIDQKPPMYSALKVKGKRLYEYARAGQTVEVKTRKIFIKALDIEEISMAEHQVTFTVTCSKGTYIRTICQDVGEALGCHGTLVALERIQSGGFTLDDAVDLEALQTMTEEQIAQRLIPSYMPLIHFGEVMAEEEAGLRFITGWHLPMACCQVQQTPEFAESEFYLPLREEYRRAYKVFGQIDGEKVFLGVAFYNKEEDKFIADKVFYVR